MPSGQWAQKRCRIHPPAALPCPDRIRPILRPGPLRLPVREPEDADRRSWKRLHAAYLVHECECAFHGRPEPRVCRVRREQGRIFIRIKGQRALRTWRDNRSSWTFHGYRALHAGATRCKWSRRREDVDDVSPASSIQEITEGQLMDAPENKRLTLEKLQAGDQRVVMDDLGTGDSSLGYPKHFELDGIKTDRSIPQNLPVVAEGHRERRTCRIPVRPRPSSPAGQIHRAADVEQEFPRAPPARTTVTAAAHGGRTIRLRPPFHATALALAWTAHRSSNVSLGRPVPPSRATPASVEQR
jgi:hypothetical protein